MFNCFVHRCSFPYCYRKTSGPYIREAYKNHTLKERPSWLLTVTSTIYYGRRGLLRYWGRNSKKCILSHERSIRPASSMPMMPASWRWIYTGFVVVDGMLQQHSSGLNIHNDYVHHTLGLNGKKSSKYVIEIVSI